MAIMDKKFPLGRSRACAWFTLSVFILGGGAAVAQQTETGALEEIVVTAQKRSEDLQQVPIAISAFSAETLQRKGITSVDQLSNLSPNVNLDAGAPSATA